jgi:hypothetical protein
LTSRFIESQRRPRIVENSIDGEAPPTLNVPSPPKEIIRSEFLRQETSITHASGAASFATDTFHHRG